MGKRGEMTLEVPAVVNMLRQAGATLRSQIGAPVYETVREQLVDRVHRRWMSASRGGRCCQTPLSRSRLGSVGGDRVPH